MGVIQKERSGGMAGFDSLMLTSYFFNGGSSSRTHKGDRKRQTTHLCTRERVSERNEKRRNQQDRGTKSTDSLSENSRCLVSNLSGTPARTTRLTCRPSALHRPLLVLVGAMVTTGGVLGTPWPLV